MRAIAMVDLAQNATIVLEYESARIAERRRMADCVGGLNHARTLRIEFDDKSGSLAMGFRSGLIFGDKALLLRYRAGIVDFSIASRR